MSTISSVSHPLIVVLADVGKKLELLKLPETRKTLNASVPCNIALVSVRSAFFYDPVWFFFLFCGILCSFSAATGFLLLGFTYFFFCLFSFFHWHPGLMVCHLFIFSVQPNLLLFCCGVEYTSQVGGYSSSGILNTAHFHSYNKFLDRIIFRISSLSFKLVKPMIKVDAFSTSWNFTTKWVFFFLFEWNQCNV